VHEFEVDLRDRQNASFALSHHAPGCELELDLYAPPVLAWFRGERVARWRDGAAFGAVTPDTAAPSSV
jgi:hypothetical protein